MLNRSQLSAPNRRKTATVKLHEGEVLIRTLSGAQREEFLLDLKDAEEKDVKIPPGLTVKIACWSLVNPDMSRMYQDEEINEVGDLDADDLESILRASLRLSGLTEDSAGEAAKNSQASQNEESGSGSQKLSVAQ